jgi:hypothetical protein
VDEAFSSIGETIVALVDQPGIVGGGAFGQRVTMTAIDLELPLELDVTRSEEGLCIGSTPPLYALRTSMLPSFHRLHVRASLQEEPRDG